VPSSVMLICRAFGSPVRLVWVKRRWVSPELDCSMGSWTGTVPTSPPARAVMTTPAGL